MKKYLRENDTVISDDESFNEKKIKETEGKIEKNTYQEIVKAWGKKNNAVRNVTDREKLEGRFERFMKSLKGFTDWNTAGGDIKDWEKYQLKRWEAYKDLTKADEDLPKSLTTRKEIRKAEKK